MKNDNETGLGKVLSGMGALITKIASFLSEHEITIEKEDTSKIMDGVYGFEIDPENVEIVKEWLEEQDIAVSVSAENPNLITVTVDFNEVTAEPEEPEEIADVEVQDSVTPDVRGTVKLFRDKGGFTCQGFKGKNAKLAIDAYLESSKQKLVDVKFKMDAANKETVKYEEIVKNLSEINGKEELHECIFNLRSLLRNALYLSVKVNGLDDVARIMAIAHELTKAKSQEQIDEILMRTLPLAEMNPEQAAEITMELLTDCVKVEDTRRMVKRYYDAISTSQIKAKNPGLLKIPEGKTFYTVGNEHYVNLAKKLGKPAVMRGLVNLERWNKNKNPDLAKKARAKINSLEASSDWKSIGAK